MDTDLFDELENFGKPPKKQEQTPVVAKQSNAMDRLLKEASEFDRESTRKAASRKSNKSKDAGDFNEAILEKPKEDEKEASKEPEVPKEPMGFIENPHGKPQVVHDDPYLEPFMHDLYLRQNEYKK